MIINPIKFWRDLHAPDFDVMNQVRTTRAREMDGNQKSNERKGTVGWNQ
jgi:hypothetical protein